MKQILLPVGSWSPASSFDGDSERVVPLDVGQRDARPPFDEHRGCLGVTLLSCQVQRRLLQLVHRINRMTSLVSNNKAN